MPLTSGLIAHLYGLRYMGTLYGIVFFSHQLGSFLGVWLGGRLYDVTGDYTLVWWIGIAVGAMQGYHGGAVDITVQRMIEIWSALPFLYIMILMGSVYGRSFALLLFE